MMMLTKISQVVQTYMILRGPLLFPHHVGPISVGLQECFVLQFVYYNFITNHLFNNHFHHVGLVVVGPQECCLFYLYILIISIRRNLFQSHHHHHHQIIVLIIIIIIIISTCMVVIPPTPPTTF